LERKDAELVNTSSPRMARVRCPDPVYVTNTSSIYQEEVDSE
jgi:hypothetical protein